MADHTDSTVDRILNAAGRQFAQNGFRHTSVRDICADANANQAAVNYHFGSKEKLYLEVWKVAAEQMQADATMPRMTEGEDPESVLRAFIAWFMALVMVKCDEDRWTGDLLAHETANPTPAAMSIFVERCCRPVSDELHRIVCARLGPDSDNELVDGIVYGIIAMCINPKHSASIYAALGHEVPSSAESVSRLAEAIADLALFGMRGIALREQSRVN